jgi:hypothetical protein
MASEQAVAAPKEQKPRAVEFLKRIETFVQVLHGDPRYKTLRVMVELDERGKLPSITVRAATPEVKLLRDGKKQAKK